MAKAYEEQATAILGDKTLDPWYKRILLKGLGEEFGEDVPETEIPEPAPVPAQAHSPGTVHATNPDAEAAFLRGLAAGAVGGATGVAGGMNGITGASKPAAQPIIYDNASRDFSTVGQRFEPRSPFMQGLQGEQEGNTPAPVSTPTPGPVPGPVPSTSPASSPDAKADSFLEHLDFKDTQAGIQEPSEAGRARQAQTAPVYSSEVTKLQETVKNLNATNAPYEAIQSAQRALDRQKEYEDRSRAVLGDNTLDSWHKNILLQELDEEYAKRRNTGSATVWDGGAAVEPQSSPTEAEQLENLLDNMKSKYAPYEAIQQVEKALKKQMLMDALAQMKAKNAPYEAIQQVEKAIDQLRNPYAKPAPTPGELYGSQDEALYQEYIAECDAIDRNRQLPDYVKGSRKASLSQDSKYASMLERRKNQQLVAESDKKLRGIVDQINSINRLLNDKTANITKLDRINLKEQKDNLITKFGLGVQGLDGDTIDPKKVVSIQINGQDFRGARYENGFATANMEDIVKAFGGSVKWDSVHESASIRDADGKFVTSIKIKDGQAWEVDMRGRPVRQIAMAGFAPQMDIVQVGEMLGVPVSYYHDENGIFHAYAHKGERNAPVQVVRKEGDVYITANIEFVGKHANDIYPGTEQLDPKTGKPIPGTGKTYAQLAYDGINTKWNPSKSFNISGFAVDNNGNRIKDQNGNYVYAGNEKVNVHTRIISNYSTSSGKVVGNAPGQNPVKIYIDNDSILSSKFGLTSHVLTEDPKKLALQGATFLQGLLGMPVDPALMAESVESGKRLAMNFTEALINDEPVQLLDNWSIENPGQVWLYDREKDQKNQTQPQYYTPDWYSNTAGHEFGHVVDLGDAYPAFYRYMAKAIELLRGVNQQGENVVYQTPADDAMLSNGPLSENDVRMFLQGRATNDPQFFSRDPIAEAQTKTDLVNGVINTGRDISGLIPGVGLLYNLLVPKDVKVDENWNITK